MPTYLPRNQAGHPRASPGLAEIANGGLHEQARILLVLPELDTLGEQSEVWLKKVADEGRANDLEVERVKGVHHGWTQYPEEWLSEEHKQLKVEVFRKAREFVKTAWAIA
jgi:acetyl esterase/lipase